MTTSFVLPKWLNRLVLRLNLRRSKKLPEDELNSTLDMLLTPTELAKKLDLGQLGPDAVVDMSSVRGRKRRHDSSKTVLLREAELRARRLACLFDSVKVSLGCNATTIQVLIAMTQLGYHLSPEEIECLVERDVSLHANGVVD